MKKYLLLVAGIIILTGCDSKKEFKFELEGNPTTGYEWTCKIGDSSIVKEKTSKYKADDTDSVGSGGTYTFIYEGLKEGKTTVSCEYERSFEKNSTEKTKKYELSVDKNLNIKENK